MSNRIVEIFPELEFKFFSPAQVADLTGVNPEKQRIWKHRHDVSFDASTDDTGVRLLHWAQVMQWALMAQLAKYGINLNTAAKIAGSPKIEQYHWFDERRLLSGAPLFLFFRYLPDEGEVEVTSGGGPIRFNTSDEFWQQFGGWIDYSLVQRRVIGLYEANRKSVGTMLGSRIR